MNCPQCGHPLYPDVVGAPVARSLFTNLNAANGCNPAPVSFVIDAANAINPGSQVTISLPASNINAAAGCAGIYPTVVQF